MHLRRSRKFPTDRLHSGTLKSRRNGGWPLHNTYYRIRSSHGEVAFKGFFVFTATDTGKRAGGTIDIDEVGKGVEAIDQRIGGFGNSYWMCASS